MVEKISKRKIYLIAVPIGELKKWDNDKAKIFFDNAGFSKSHIIGLTGLNKIQFFEVIE